MPPPLDVLLVTRACAERYPPTINQANLLAGAGLRVGMIDLLSDGISTVLHPAILRWRAHSEWNSKTEPVQSLFRRCANWLSFRQTCRKVIGSEKPKVVLAYDILGSAFIPPQQRSYRTVYHFHELTVLEPGMRMGTRWALQKARQSSRQADLVVFSDQHRAESYQHSAGLSTRPEVVMNCPVRLPAIPISPLRTILQQRGWGRMRPICYVGSVGINQGLSEAALSMQYWPDDTIFVLVGPYSGRVQSQILENARAVKADSRVLFLGPQSHANALALTAGAVLGLSLIQPNWPNLLYSAGAVNKRFEYMALGLPQVTNNGPGVAEIIEHNQLGLCADPNSPEAIGAAINRLLRDQVMLKKMGENGRRLHLKNYNYETQFSPVLSWIKGQCDIAN